MHTARGVWRGVVLVGLLRFLGWGLAVGWAESRDSLGLGSSVDDAYSMFWEILLSPCLFESST